MVQNHLISVGNFFTELFNPVKHDSSPYFFFFFPWMTTEHYIYCYANLLSVIRKGVYAVMQLIYRESEQMVEGECTRGQSSHFLVKLLCNNIVLVTSF